MWIIPAIDILGGRCVRLRGGDYDEVQTYDDDPSAVAERFFDAGVKRLHVVDLDAAAAGKPMNTDIIRRILDAARPTNAEVEVGGGLRDEDAVTEVLDAGAAYAILGTAAVRDATFRRQMIADFPGQIIVGVDVRDGKVAVAGWREDSHRDSADFLAELHDAPPAAIIYTDIHRDGMLSGVNIAATADAAEQAPCPVIASGGVAAMDDLRAAADAALDGIIIGKALYSGAISLADALAMQA